MRGIQKFKEQELLPFVKPFASMDVDCDIFNDEDANHNKYLYICLKSRIMNVVYYGKRLVTFLQTNKIKYTAPSITGDKALIWIPFDQKIKYLIHSLVEVYEVN